jgi:hypothetical protein
MGVVLRMIGNERIEPAPDLEHVSTYENIPGSRRTVIFDLMVSAR